MTPQWLAKVLTEHLPEGGLGWTRDQDGCSCGLVLPEYADFLAHLAAVVWAEFTAHAQQAREDVILGVIDLEADLADPSVKQYADVAVAALLRAMGGGEG
jgi:hypothetical protein